MWGPEKEARLSLFRQAIRIDEEMISKMEDNLKEYKGKSNEPHTEQHGQTAMDVVRLEGNRTTGGEHFHKVA